MLGVIYMWKGEKWKLDREIQKGNKEGTEKIEK
jgi:hypothetical protein